MENLEKELNKEQKKAVLYTEGPLMIIAGAGAGKTKTITERIRHLVSSGVDPTRILAITFTNKAAREMRERIGTRLAKDLSINRPISMTERPFVSTFHSLGVHILREQSERAGVRRHFAILDRDDSKKAVKEALVFLGLDPKTHDPAKLLGAISREKGKGWKAENFIEEADGGGYFKDVLRQVWPEYEKILKRDNALDFDDLILKTRDLLEEDGAVRNYYQNVWNYIHVDEYQDTNRIQYDISRLLAGDKKNICVVGDIDQNIYSWRGADIRNIIDFEKDYPDAHIVTLEENYRSTRNILHAANTIIEKNKIRREKNLFTSNAEGGKIGLFGGLDEVSEAEFVASKAEELIKEGQAPEEIAVLYRANFQSRVLEESFMKRGLPYQLLGTKFFERKEVKDIIAYLRASLDRENLGDFKRVINTPARGIGKVTMLKVLSGKEDSLPAKVRIKIKDFRELLRKIAEFSKDNKLSETIAFIIKKSGLEEEWKTGKEEGTARLENAYELASFAKRYDELSPEEAVLQFLADTALQSDQDELIEDPLDPARGKQKAVRLMTVHASKGLEFDTVFIAGLEDGLFPHQRANASSITQEEAEEERRLFYVALTRARKKIYLSYAQMRTLFGRRDLTMPSEFIADIPKDLLEEEVLDEESVGRRPLLEIEF